MTNLGHSKIGSPRVRHTRYYEHDGMLRAYANRSMVLAIVFAAMAFGSFGFAVYVRLQPPTVIRVDNEGQATVVGGRPLVGRSDGVPYAGSAANATPSEIECRAVVRRFLESYLNYTPSTVDWQMRNAQSMMTANFQNLVRVRLMEGETIKQIKDDHIVTSFTMHPIHALANSPLTYTTFGVKEIHRTRNEQETTDTIIGRYYVRLAVVERTEHNPSGLLVAEFWEQQMIGQTNSGLAQTDLLSREAAAKSR